MESSVLITNKCWLPFAVPWQALRSWVYRGSCLPEKFGNRRINTVIIGHCFWNHQTPELLKLEKISKIIESNYQPGTARSIIPPSATSTHLLNHALGSLFQCLTIKMLLMEIKKAITAPLFLPLLNKSKRNERQNFWKEH